MSPFDGFSKEVFESCEESEKIRVPINSLKRLQSEIEPRLKAMNSGLIGHVSRTKRAGTNDYNGWAWLYFNTIGTGAYRYSQLTVNISPFRVYAGVNLRRKTECYALQSKIRKEKNEWLLQQIMRTLGSREWIFSTRNDGWTDQIPRRYSPQELRGLLLDPELYWINACFEEDEPIVRTTRIGGEIARIFRELYNIYALASNNKIISQPKPKSESFEPKVVVDSGQSVPKSDEKMRSDIERFLSSLEAFREISRTHLSGKRDQYFVKRVALDLDLKPYQLNYKGNPIVVYSDHDVRSIQDKIMKNYSDFRQRINRIEDLLELPEDFLKMMYVNPQSDARYQRVGKAKAIFLNLARFNHNKDT